MPRSRFLQATLIAGLLFLYLPIGTLVAYSFNAGKLVTVWAGFSTRWYAELLRNEALLNAAWLSLRIAAASATLAVVMGTLAGFVLARFGLFRGRALFSGMIAAPLVMPEVIMGLAMLMLFVTLEQIVGWPEGRGATTIFLAHTTFTLSFVAVLVQSRIAGLDRSLEEAAMDLGARPTKVFLVITLPIISPALLSGWLLAFTLSLDDLVITSFVSGPGSTTLPQYIFSSVRLGLNPQINALATILVTIVAFGIGLAAWLGVRRQRARARPALEA